MAKGEHLSMEARGQRRERSPARRAVRAGGIIERKLTERVENINHYEVEGVLGRHTSPEGQPGISPPTRASAAVFAARATR